MIDDAIAEAIGAIRTGEVIGLPTDTVYGIGVDPLRPDATARVFAVKRRPEAFPLPVLVASPEDARELGELGELGEKLAAAFWPGPLTLVVPRKSGAFLHLGGEDSTVGVRCPDRPLTRRLLEQSGPLAVTSANLHGRPPATTAAALRHALGPAVRVVIDDGECSGVPSTVVSLVSGEPLVLREGSICGDAIRMAVS